MGFRTSNFPRGETPGTSTGADLMNTTTSRPRTRLGLESLDDRCVPATLSIGDATVVEQSSGVQNAAVVVTLSGPVNKPVTVNYGTGNWSAMAGSDFAAVSGKLTFAKGEISKTILVPVYGDQLPEYDESFFVQLTNARGASIADGDGIVRILDTSPRLSISNEVGYEGGVITFTVTLSAPLATAFTVDFSTRDGDPVESPAYAGQDYVAASGTLTFAPGETTKTITVQILADGITEYEEYFNVFLSNPSAPAFIIDGAWGTIYGELGM